MLVPLPAEVTPPGLRVRTHDPEGSEFNMTLPVATAQVGCVTVPIEGAVGVNG